MGKIQGTCKGNKLIPRKTTPAAFPPPTQFTFAHANYAIPHTTLHIHVTCMWSWQK